jgi:hypothetical protein
VCHRVHLGASMRACPGVYMRMSSVYLGADSECTWQYLESSLRGISQAGWECNQECTSELTSDPVMKSVCQL